MNEERQKKKRKIRDQIEGIDKKIAELNRQKSMKKRLLMDLDREDIFEALRTHNMSSDELVNIIEGLNKGVSTDIDTKQQKGEETDEEDENEGEEQDEGDMGEE